MSKGWRRGRWGVHGHAPESDAGRARFRASRGGGVAAHWRLLQLLVLALLLALSAKAGAAAESGLAVGADAETASPMTLPEAVTAALEQAGQLIRTDALRGEAERELVAAPLGRRGAAQALQVAERRARLAADALAVAERAFELGETDLAERLLAERRSREANLDLALRRAEQGQAFARVNQALGMIPQ